VCLLVICMHFVGAAFDFFQLGRDSVWRVIERLDETGVGKSFFYFRASGFEKQRQKHNVFQQREGAECE